MNCLRKGKPLRTSPWWLRHRTSPQSDYWVKEGQQLVSEIRRREKKGSLYGESTYHRFDTESAYRAKIAELIAQGEKFA